MSVVPIPDVLPQIVANDGCRALRAAIADPDAYAVEPKVDGRLLAVAATICVLITGCGSSSSSPSLPLPAATSSSSTPSPLSLIGSEGRPAVPTLVGSGIGAGVAWDVEASDSQRLYLLDLASNTGGTNLAINIDVCCGVEWQHQMDEVQPVIQQHRVWDYPLDRHPGRSQPGHP
jgi:hypothetical protein